MIVQFDSIGQFLSKTEQDWDDNYDRNSNMNYADPQWHGSVTSAKDAFRRAREGDLEIAPTISDAVYKVMPMQHAVTPRMRYAPHLAGSRVSVPDYLGGNPRCMRKRTLTDTPVQSVRMFVSTSAAAGISADIMQNRGATIIALIQFLQMQNAAVELYLVSELYSRVCKTGDYIQVVRLETSPLDLSTAGFAIAHVAFARCLMYNQGHSSGHWDRRNWALSSKHGTDSSYLKPLLGLTEGDILIKGVSYYDECVTAPEKWLTTHIQQLGYQTQ